jgi:hypothetical protein
MMVSNTVTHNRGWQWAAQQQGDAGAHWCIALHDIVSCHMTSAIRNPHWHQWVWAQLLPPVSSHLPPASVMLRVTSRAHSALSVLSPAAMPWW